MKTKEWFKGVMNRLQDDFDFRLESIILKITESICKRMKEKKMQRIDLADKLTVSPAAITKILNGTNNFTLKTLLSLADALDMNLKVEYEEKQSTESALITPLKTSNILTSIDEERLKRKTSNCQTTITSAGSEPISIAAA